MGHWTKMTAQSEEISKSGSLARYSGLWERFRAFQDISSIQANLDRMLCREMMHHPSRFSQKLPKRVTEKKNFSKIESEYSRLIQRSLSYPTLNSGSF
jgi:hypothetical protein